MSHDAITHAVHAANRALAKWGLADVSKGEDIGALVAAGVSYWEQNLADGCHLAVIRLSAPLVDREEIFLGNILLNEFLAKTILRVVEDAVLGHMALLANDLEDFYYLYHGPCTVNQLKDRFHEELAAALPDLFCGDEDPGRGVYGDVAQMFAFYKSNIEPFPIFAVPRRLLPYVLCAVNRRLLELASDDDTNINVMLSMLSFFYAKDGTEMQSFYAFLSRAMEEGLLPTDKLRAAFALTSGQEFTKATFNERKNSGVVHRASLSAAIEQFVERVQHEIDRGHPQAIAPYVATKMLSLDGADVSTYLCRGLRLGFVSLGPDEPGCEPPLSHACRFCGASPAVVVEKTIIAGFNAGRFHNRSPEVRPFNEVLCVRCGVAAYLMIKLLGMQIARPQPKGKDFPVPKLHNVLFHYGHHDSLEAQRLGQTIRGIITTLRDFQQTARRDGAHFSVEYMRRVMASASDAREAHAGELPAPEDALAAILADDAAAPALETLAQMTTDMQVRVLPLGTGEYRLLAFVLPSPRPGRKEALDYVQGRLSGSRLLVCTLLALLRRLCGCRGPYYYRSDPTLRLGGGDTDTFYLCGRRESAQQALRRYGAIVNFARRVTKYRDGHSLLADWIVLAERLDKDPLATLADVLRNSALRGGEDLREASFRRLSEEFIKGTGVIDGVEYLELIERMKRR